MGKSCKSCYFYGKCGYGKLCDDYTCISDNQYSDDELSEMLECGYQDYLRAWFEYISDFE